MQRVCPIITDLSRVMAVMTRLRFTLFAKVHVDSRPAHNTSRMRDWANKTPVRSGTFSSRLSESLVSFLTDGTIAVSSDRYLIRNKHRLEQKSEVIHPKNHCKKRERQKHTARFHLIWSAKLKSKMPRPVNTFFVVAHR